MSTSAAVFGMQGGIAAHCKRQRKPSSGKRKLDRLNFLFEAIEADKASDSDTALGADSKGSQGCESDSPLALCAHGEETCLSGVHATAAA